MMGKSMILRSDKSEKYFYRYWERYLKVVFTSPLKIVNEIYIHRMTQLTNTQLPPLSAYVIYIP